MPGKTKAAKAATAKNNEDNLLLHDAMKLANAERRAQGLLAQDDDESQQPSRNRPRKQRFVTTVPAETNASSTSSTVAIEHDVVEPGGQATIEALVSTPTEAQSQQPARKRLRKQRAEPTVTNASSTSSTSSTVAIEHDVAEHGGQPTLELLAQFPVAVKSLNTEATSRINPSKVVVKLEGRPTDVIDLTETMNEPNRAKKHAFMRTTLLSDHYVVPTSSEHMLCGFHALCAKTGDPRSAHELKRATMDFMLSNPDVPLNDAGHTTASLAAMNGLDVPGYVSSLATMHGAEATTISAGCVMLHHSFAVYQRNSDCPEVLNLTLSNTVATGTGSLMLLFDAPPSNVAQHVPFAIGHFSGLERKSVPTLSANARRVLHQSAPSTPTKPRPASIPNTPPSAVHSASSTPTMTPSKTFGTDSVETSLTGSLLDLALPAIVQNLSSASKAFVATSARTRNPTTLEFTVKVTDVTDTALHFGLSYKDQDGREREEFLFIGEGLDSDGRFNDHTTGGDIAVVNPTTEWNLKGKTPTKISPNLEYVLRAAETSVIEKAFTTKVPVNTPIGKFLADLKNDTGNNKTMFEAALRGCIGFYPVGDMRSFLTSAIVTPTKRLIPPKGGKSTVDMHIPPAMLETNKVFTYAVATKKPFTPIATSHTLSTGEYVKHGLHETNCFTSIPGYCNGRPLLITAGLSAVTSVNKNTGKLYMKVRPVSTSLFYSPVEICLITR